MECDSNGDCPSCNALTPCQENVRPITAHAYLPGMLPPNRTGSLHSHSFGLIKGVKEFK